MRKLLLFAVLLMCSQLFSQFDSGSLAGFTFTGNSMQDIAIENHFVNSINWIEFAEKDTVPPTGSGLTGTNLILLDTYHSQNPITQKEIGVSYSGVLWESDFGTDLQSHFGVEAYFTKKLTEAEQQYYNHTWLVNAGVYFGRFNSSDFAGSAEYDYNFFSVGGGVNYMKKIYFTGNVGVLATNSYSFTGNGKKSKDKVLILPGVNAKYNILDTKNFNISLNVAGYYSFEDVDLLDRDSGGKDHDKHEGGGLATFGIGFCYVFDK